MFSYVNTKNKIKYEIIILKLLGKKKLARSSYVNAGDCDNEIDDDDDDLTVLGSGIVFHQHHNPRPASKYEVSFCAFRTQIIKTFFSTLINGI